MNRSISRIDDVFAVSSPKKKGRQKLWRKRREKRASRRSKGIIDWARG